MKHRTIKLVLVIALFTLLSGIASAWEFNTLNNKEDWIVHNIISWSVESDGRFRIDPDINDPYIESPSISVSANNFNTIAIKMSSNAPDQNGAIYFKTSTSPEFSDDKKVEFSVTTGPSWYDYSILMTPNPRWTGTITGIRVDPSNTGRTDDSDAIGFDYIRLKFTVPTVSDTEKPKVNSMSAAPSSLSLGKQVTVSYSVQDNTALKQVELWYKEPGGDWNSVETKSISGMSSFGSFSPHIPSKAGTNSYGIHVVDTAGNWDSEGSAGPKTVEVIAPTQGPSITVISPNGGENWELGTTNTIKWNYVGNIGSGLKIELFKRGTFYKTIASKVPIGTSGSGSYGWKISSTQTPGNDYQIRLTSTTNSVYTDTSNNFGIDIPLITGITPELGVKGMAITIKGKNFGKKPGTVLFGETPAKLGQPNDDYGKLKWSDTEIVALVPIGVGTVQVNIKESKGTISNGVPFTYLDVPIVSQWRWPRDKAVEGQKYANPYSPYRLHTGIDVYETQNDLKGAVFAAADGVVVAKCPTGQKCPGFSTNPTNHVLMGVVIIAHRLSDGTLIYSMYGDMADVSSTPEPGETVHMGDLLGQTGIVAGSFGWVTHVHFEIKNEPVLHNPSWKPGDKIIKWGYTETNPDDYGYRNAKPFINLLQPLAPTLISPINGATKVSITPTMSWDSGAQPYRIQVSSNKGFTNIVFDQSDIITTSITIPALNHKTKYWWRVDARNLGGVGLWSKVWSFTTV